MGLMDKVKAQASQAAAKVQEGVKTGQAKLDDAQAAKRADALLRDLGAAVYAKHTGRGDASTASEVDRLVGELQEHEATHKPIDLAPKAGGAAPAEGAEAPPAPGAPSGGPDVPPPPAPPAPPAAPAEPAGNFSLDDL